MRRGFRTFISSISVLAILCGVVSEAGADTSPTKEAPVGINEELKKADQLISVERLEEALAALKAIEPDTTNTSAKINVLLGKIYQRLHRPSKASELFERASFSSIEDGEAYLGLAETSLALGKLGLARRYSKETIRSNPDLVGAHLVLARVDDRMGQTAKAKERFSSLIQNQPDSEPIIKAYAQFLSQREDTDAAIKTLSKFMNRHPDAAEAGDLLGQLYWQQGKRVDAIQTRTHAAKAFLAKGNEFRAEAIKSWLAANDPNGQYVGQVSPRTSQTPFPAPVVTEQPKNAEPAPAPSAVPVPEVKEAKLPDVLRPTPQKLKRPDPLPLPEGVMLSTGSGFIIDGGRYVITNHHVIDKTGKIAVRTGTGEVRRARILRIAKDDDLAILELSEPFPSSYAITTQEMGDANTGRSAVVMGFPMAGIIGWQQPSLTEGIVSKASGFDDNPNTFLITSKMNKGNSGGPIFDRQGRLIGIAVAKLDTTAIYEERGSLPEDVNIGIKVSRLLNFLKKSGGGKQSTAPEISLEELYQGMLSKVVLVAAEAK
jgi:S1-C subfamily serine protease/Tfp pilus assembly protein PilF